MLIIIRKDARLSRKTEFFINLFSRHSSDRIFYVFKLEGKKFQEKWWMDHVELASSAQTIMMNYSLIMLRSPIEFQKALLKRYSFTSPKRVLAGKGFLSMLRRAMYLSLGTSARADMLMRFLSKLNEPTIFLIDEFISLNCIDLKKLKQFGPIIYVSQDIAYKRYDFASNFIARKLMLHLEQDAILNIDLTIACSEKEKLEYLEMGARNAIFYPNIYPSTEFKPCNKDKTPSICIVLRDHWGFNAEQSLEAIFDALSRLHRRIRVYLIGVKPLKIPRNITLVYYEFIPSKLDYLRLLSKSWIGINVGIHAAGTNERKYDYAEAGTVVLSDTLGARGDLIPHEYTYVDSEDFVAKLGQLLEFGKVNLREMGKKNREHTLSLAEKQRQSLLDTIRDITSGIATNI